MLYVKHDSHLSQTLFVFDHSAMHYTKAIRAWRTQRGLSQAEFGEALGYTSPQSRISNYEKEVERGGREPSWSDFERMAAFFHVSVPEFLTGPDGRRPKADLESVDPDRSFLSIEFKRLTSAAQKIDGKSPISQAMIRSLAETIEAFAVAIGESGKATPGTRPPSFAPSVQSILAAAAESAGKGELPPDAVAFVQKRVKKALTTSPSPTKTVRGVKSG